MYGAQSELLAEEFEMEGFPDEEMEFDDEYEGAELAGEGDFDDEEMMLEGEAPFDDDEEMELAAELLEVVDDDEELEQFLGKLFRRAARGVRRFSRSRLGRRLLGKLKGFARRSLTNLGRRAGGRLLGPAGAAAGGRLAAAAGRRFFGLELEGLSPEDQELEVARRVVRFASAAARNAARAAGRGPASQVANKALATAARRFAPGLLRGGARGRRGVWVRRGNKIIVLGA